MISKDGWRDALRAAVFENFWLKIISLMVALGFYAFIHGAENAQRTVAVSVVSIMPHDGNRQLMTQIPNEVAVTLRGSRTQLDDLHQDDLGSMQLDLSSGRETRVDLDPSMFHVPPGITVEQIHPPTIELRWDDVVERPITVQIARTGQANDGFEVKGNVRAEPQTLNARGPRSVVDVMQFARAAPFDVSGLTEGEHRRALAVDKPPRLVTLDAENVTGIVEVVRKRGSRDFEAKVEVIGLPRATVKPKTVNVHVEGPAEVVNSLIAEAIVPRVEPKPENPGLADSQMLDVLVDVPGAAVRVTPAKVLVKW